MSTSSKKTTQRKAASAPIPSPRFEPRTMTLTGAAVLTPMSSVSVALSGLGSALEDLRGRVTELDRRLVPVMEPEAPHPDGVSDANSAPKSPLVLEINEHTNDVASLISQVQTILSRLAV